MADNNTSKQGGNIAINGCDKPIIPPHKLLEMNEKDIAILITSDVYAYEIYRQLEDMFKEKDIDICKMRKWVKKGITCSLVGYAFLCYMRNICGLTRG